MSKTVLSKSIIVDESKLACAVGSGSLRVLATPAVAALMENVSAALAQEVLNNPEFTTVGTMLCIEHTSPTPLGAEVTATVKLIDNDGRNFKFEVYAEDKKGIIAKGTHTRVSVKSEKFQKKAEEKYND